MTLIDGDRIITAHLYDDQYEEFTEKKMSIIDYVNAYTDEGVTTAELPSVTPQYTDAEIQKMQDLEQAEIQKAYELGKAETGHWIPVSERLPEKSGDYWCTFGGTNLTGCDYYTTESDARKIFDEPEEYTGWRSQNVIAWMPLPEPYKESKEV